MLRFFTPPRSRGGLTVRRGRRPGASALVLLGAVMVLGLTSGCAGYSEHTLEARTALDAGQPRRALALIDQQMDVKSAKDLPDKVVGDNSLFILDRAMILQSLDRYKLSSRDLRVADKAIDLLDMSETALDTLGKYMFSGSSGPYRAPAYEKLMINTMNMVNYLVQGDLQGARVEARRLAVIQNYIKSHKDPADALNGPGSYLAGFTFEKSGDANEALHYYDEALAYGDYHSLYGPIRRLSLQSDYRTDRINRILREGAPARAAPPAVPPKDNPRSGDAPPSAPPRQKPPSTQANNAPPAAPNKQPASTTSASSAALPAAPAPSAPKAQTATADRKAASAKAALPRGETKDGELLVIVSFGRVPSKYARRLPIGLALTYASGFISPSNVALANRLALQGLVTWVNYPELGRAHGQYQQPEFALDGQWQELEGVIAIDREVRKAWDQVRGRVVAAAITRMITRIVAGEITRRAAGGGLVGELLSLGTQATLTATDVPDTRSWATLPARMAFGRVRVAPGEHWVLLGASGFEKRERVDVRPGGWAVVNLTVLR
jgi:uncharacterized protein